MAEITAKMVNELRGKTGQGMMECKKALKENDGDIEKAIEWFRKKGVKTSVTERAANEGRVGVAAGADGKSAAIFEVRCNTDFAARSELVGQIVETGARKILANAGADLASDADLKEKITAASQQTGENIQVGRTAALSNPSGRVGTYSHYTGKIGILVSLTGNPSDELIKDLCLHIAATRPIALRREEVSPDLVSKEREIAIDQARQTGKPQQIAEKIAEGKMRTFFEERVLLDQKFVKDDSKTITQLLKDNSTSLEKYVRVEVGQ